MKLWPTASPARRLKERLRDRTADLTSDAAASGTLDTDALNEVEELDRLAQIGQRVRRPPRYRAWALPAGTLLASALLAGLVFGRVPCTEVAIVAELSSLAFQLGDAAGGTSQDERADVLDADVPVQRMTLRGIERIEVDGKDVEVPFGGGFRITSKKGALLAPLAPAAGTWVRLTPQSGDNDASIQLRHADLPPFVETTLPPEVQIFPAGELAETVGETIHVRAWGAAGRRLTLDLLPSDMDAFNSAVAGNIPIRDLIFTDIDTSASQQHKEFSTVRGGSLYLEEIGGEERSLRQGDYLRLNHNEPSSPWTTVAGWLLPSPNSCSATGLGSGSSFAGTITSIGLAGDRLSLNARADVRSLSIGTPGHFRNQMPHWIDLVQRQAGPFWTTMIYVFGLVIGVARALGLGR